MTTLYLIRHAEAEGNLYRRIHGQYNSLITDNGYRQIAALRDRFANVPIDAVYSSDLFRTMTTARALFVPKGLPLVTRSDLREISMGQWEDYSWAGIDRREHARMALFSWTSPPSTPTRPSPPSPTAPSSATPWPSSWGSPLRRCAKWATATTPP